MTDTRPDKSGHAVNKSAQVVLGAKSKDWDKEVSLRAHQYLQTGGNEAQIRAKMNLNKQITGPRPALKPLQATPPQAEPPLAPQDDGDITPPQFHEDNGGSHDNEYRTPEIHLEGGYNEYQTVDD